MLPDELTTRLSAAASGDRVVLASDFDGVLAPLGHDPAAVRPLPGGVEALRAAAALPGTCVAVVSGRDLGTLAALTGLEAGDGIVLIGSHGSQTNRPDLVEHVLLTPEQEALLADLDAGLTALVAVHPGSRIERKPAAVVLHTRGMPLDADEAACAAALDLADAHPGTHPMRGKKVVELAVTATTKGTALLALGASVDAQATVYLGDDVTDETAFAALSPERDVTVKVGDGDTVAVTRLADEGAVVEALQLFVRVRSTR